MVYPETRAYTCNSIFLLPEHAANAYSNGEFNIVHLYVHQFVRLLTAVSVYALALCCGCWVSVCDAYILPANHQSLCRVCYSTQVREDKPFDFYRRGGEIWIANKFHFHFTNGQWIRQTGVHPHFLLPFFNLHSQIFLVLQWAEYE